MDLVVPIGQSARELELACGNDPDWLCRRLLDAGVSTDVAQVIDFVFGRPLTIALIVLAAAVVNWLVRRAIKRTLRRLAGGGIHERLGSLRELAPDVLVETGEHEVTSARAAQRIEALTTVLRSLASLVIWVTTAFIVLDELGLDIAPLLAGAGVVGVALGFGAQSLVKDFLAGMFILVEDQYGVGDIIDIQDASGVVEAVSLRATRIRAVDGTLWHVPNGELRLVGNKSQHWARALLDVEVAYSADLQQARSVIKQAADETWHEGHGVLSEPELWGVESLGPSGVVIRLVVKTEPARQWEVSRLLRERIKNAMDAHGIETPFPQQPGWYGPPPGEGGGDSGGGKPAPAP